MSELSSIITVLTENVIVLGFFLGHTNRGVLEFKNTEKLKFNNMLHQYFQIDAVMLLILYNIYVTFRNKIYTQFVECSRHPRVPGL